MVKNSFICLNLSFMIVLSALSNSKILSNKEFWFGLRYFVACQILASSVKKTF